MRLLFASVLVLAAFPLLAESLPPTPGYFLGCDAETSPAACYVNAAGITWALSSEAAEEGLFDTLQALPLLEPVILSGEYAELGDSFADLTLTGVELPADEDLYVGNLRAMQGDWQPVGEEAPFAVTVVGLDWQEKVNGKPGETYMISAGLACADGVEPGGMAISLYRYGDDPAADACWQLDYIDDGSMALRNVMGDQGQVEFTRLPPEN